MNLEELRGLVQEALTTANLQSKDLQNKIKHDLHYLKDFKFTKFGKDNKGSYKWVFNFVTNDKSYQVEFYVLNNNNKWFANLDVFWKNKTDKNTADSGKDIDKKFGPFNSYNELVKELNLKLKNNLTLSTDIYKDDYVQGLDNEIVKLLKKLKIDGKALVKSNHATFKNIIDIYHKIKNMGDNDLHKFADNEWKSEADKGTAVLNLQKIDWDDFYKDMEKMGHI